MRLAHLAALTGLALPCFGAVTASPDDAPMGWASQNGGTTGGKGGKSVTVKTMADLQKYAKDPNPYIIWIDGTLGSYGTRGEGNGDRVVLASNKTILGLPGAHVKGGFDLKGVKNIILRNLVVEGPGACDNDCGSAGEARQDNISILEGTTNVWLDHLDIFDGEDGNTDITKKADFVTVSWTKFHYTDKSYPSGTSGKSHRFCNLLGGSDSPDKEGADNLSVTFYKTWWGEGVAERMPRVRFGKVHVANCLFNSKDPGQNHCIRAGYKANLLIENNVFLGQKKPIDLYDNDFTAVTAKGNLFTGCSGNTAGSGTAFSAPYTLKLSEATSVEAEVSNATSGAGANLSWSTGLYQTQAPPSCVTALAVSGGLLLDNATGSLARASVWSARGERIATDLVLAPGATLRLDAPRETMFLRTTSEGLTRTATIPALR